ncbi:MAG: hypothetical protein L6275_00100, partial [Candidatus Portnoybacteria bacterium]|nr:hypothetical protein [Candidatus Portnoybacteria bacterium]
MLFSAPINHLLVSQKDLLDLFKTGDQEKNKHAFVEAPGFKVLIFPNRQKEIVFEATRILVNDKTGREPKKTEIVDDLQTVLKIDGVEQDKLVAYGFNYDVVITPGRDNFNINNLVSDKIASMENIKNAGVHLSFEKDNIVYALDIKPIRIKQKFVAHFNAHFSANKLPAAKILKKGISAQFEELINILKKI